MVLENQVVTAPKNAVPTADVTADQVDEGSDSVGGASGGAGSISGAPSPRTVARRLVAECAATFGASCDSSSGPPARRQSWSSRSSKAFLVLHSRPKGIRTRRKTPTSQSTQSGSVEAAVDDSPGLQFTSKDLSRTTGPPFHPLAVRYAKSASDIAIGMAFSSSPTPSKECKLGYLSSDSLSQTQHAGSPLRTVATTTLRLPQPPMLANLVGFTQIWF